MEKKKKNTIDRTRKSIEIEKGRGTSATLPFIRCGGLDSAAPALLSAQATEFGHDMS